MARFFVSPEELEQNMVTLTGENAQHAKVLRLKVGEEVLLCDGEGRDALCRIAAVGAATEVEVLENDIITWSNTRIAVEVVVSPLSIENGVCSI